MYMVNIIIAIAIAFAAAVLFTSIEIPVLKKKQMGQNIREEGPESHQAKAGTPSMGGVAIIISASLAAFIAGGINRETLAMVLVMVAFGLVGFLDDFIKVIKKHNLGLRAWQKIVFQFAISAGIACWAAFAIPDGTLVYIPFADIYVDFGGWYIPFIIFTVVAMTNSVNLTDGLDGLASGCTAFTSLFFALVAGMWGMESPAAFAAAVTGACLGFLVFNKNPAKVFMGDTGSLALGGAVTAAAILMKMELLLLVAGLVYVIEALSVVIQVISFKTTGKRVFRMSPIHHHFELGGMSEKKVVVMFWIFTFICCIAGLIIVGL